jgi:hypothetical protein
MQHWLISLRSAFCYVVYVGTLIWREHTSVIAASVLLGVGASVLWVAQG